MASVARMALLAAAGLIALAAAHGSRDVSPGLSFVSAAPALLSAVRTVRAGVSAAAQPRPALAGSSFRSSAEGFSSSAFGAFVVAGSALASRCISRVVRHARRQRTWATKQRQNADYLKRNPPPGMTKSELTRRLLKIDIFRRKDLAATEFFLFNDPRDDKFQWSVVKTKNYMDEQATLVDDIKKRKLTTREQLGLGLPPTDLKLNAMMKMRGTSAGQAIKTEMDANKRKQAASGEVQTVQLDADVVAAMAAKKGAPKGGSRGPDLSNVDSEFMAFKGLAMTKKQKAAMAARAAAKKKKSR
ncbi:unnamed protein product [Polarella glacialis]|uniref:Uncharacterized protein n=2 Tax=Polarella glacialis TaxID=89957 RepID=A0A813FFU0_POLGL|nr:unnamed protein product [Polarella glacialis]